MPQSVCLWCVCAADMFLVHFHLEYRLENRLEHAHHMRVLRGSACVLRLELDRISALPCMLCAVHHDPVDPKRELGRLARTEDHFWCGCTDSKGIVTTNIQFLIYS